MFKTKAIRMKSNIAISILFTVSIFCSLFIDISQQQQQQQQQQQTITSRIRPTLLATSRQARDQEQQTKPKSQQQQQTNEQSTATSSSTSLRQRSVAAATNHSTRASLNGRLSEFVEDELPADFYEMPPEQLDLGMNATGRAPVPILNVAVLQNGQVIDSAINVHPGTPLEMVIYLDDKSAKVYGLLASTLKVQDDTFRQREEQIILNGCSIDTYIFGNFEANPEDQSLRAKFRAFKFPDSNFVRFVGTVNVCIKQCPKVNCSGLRKKRASLNDDTHHHHHHHHQDRLVQLTVSTVLRIGSNNNNAMNH